MNRLMLSLLVAFCLIAIAPCAGAVFERDWKTPGDGLLTYDDVNQREWLDVSASLLSQFPLGGLQTRYQKVVAELGPGGRFEGFQAARLSDVVSLAESAGINIHTSDLLTNEAATTRLIELLGPIGDFDINGTTMGMVNDFIIDRHYTYQYIAVFDVIQPGSVLSDRAGFFIANEPYERAEPMFVGVMLYRQVPEPCSSAIAIIVALGAPLLVRWRHPEVFGLRFHRGCW